MRVPAMRGLTALMDAVSPEAWSNPSPCEGWTARDVVSHVIETQRELFAGHDVDLGDQPDIATEPAAAWSDAAIAYDGYFGPTTLGATLEQFYIWDMYVHRWDRQGIAKATGLAGDPCGIRCARGGCRHGPVRWAEPSPTHP